MMASPMPPEPPRWDDFLAAAAASDRAASLDRIPEAPPADVLNFCDNDTLGLSRHPAVLEAAAAALHDAGAGARAARTLTGHSRHHAALESALAALKGTPSALAFPSGYHTALAALTALAGPGDTVLLDRCCHACLFDGARLSRARLRIFEHNDPASAREHLAHERARHPACRILLVAESLYSMEGDRAPLRELCDLKDEFGAWLLLDEAHATGLFGPRGEGLCAEAGLASRVEVQMGTLGKALGAAGGFIAGSADLTGLLTRRARTFLFTTAAAPATAAAATAAIGIVRGPEGTRLRKTLSSHIGTAARRLAGRATVGSPIVIVPVGGEDAALQASSALRERGLLIPAIRHPTVPRGRARLRMTLSTRHRATEIDRALKALLEILPAPA
jgi:8-amino-7-oxononanoate synthase